mgnify:CR=1 FL=1
MVFIGYLLIVLFALGLIVIFGLFITLLIVAVREAVKNYKLQQQMRRQEGANSDTTSF